MTDAVRREDASLALFPYLILGFFLLVLALAARAPAAFLQKALPASLPVQVSAWGGTVWQGQAAMVQGANNAFVDWRVQPAKLLTGRLVALLHAQGALQLDGVLELGLGRWKLDGMQGEIPVAMVQQMLPSGWSLPGAVRAENLVLARAGYGQGAWLAAGGQLYWSGGPMQYSVNGQAQGATLPPLVVTVRLDGETLVLALNEAQGSLGLATVRLTPDGQLETQLRERLLRYSPGYRGSGSDPDAVVVTARQAL